MSTIDSLSLISAITFGRDILWRIQRTKTDSNPVPLIKKGLVIISFISMFLAFSLPSVVKLFYTLGSILIPGLILPFIVTLWQNEKSIPDGFVIQWILVPVFVSLFWFGLSQIGQNPFLNIEPFYPGMGISILYFLAMNKRIKHGN